MTIKSHNEVMQFLTIWPQQVRKCTRKTYPLLFRCNVYPSLWLQHSTIHNTITWLGLLSLGVILGLLLFSLCFFTQRSALAALTIAITYDCASNVSEQVRYKTKQHKWSCSLPINLLLYLWSSFERCSYLKFKIHILVTLNLNTKKEDFIYHAKQDKSWRYNLLSNYYLFVKSVTSEAMVVSFWKSQTLVT